MAKKVIPLPLNMEDRKQLLKAIEDTKQKWGSVETVKDFNHLPKTCAVCKWSKQYVKSLAKSYQIKLTFKDDTCRFCPAYALDHNRSLCALIERTQEEIALNTFNSTFFPSVKKSITDDLERLSYTHKSQIGTTKYRKHLLEQIKLSQKLAKKKKNPQTKRSKANENKTTKRLPRSNTTSLPTEKK